MNLYEVETGDDIIAKDDIEGFCLIWQPIINQSPLAILILAIITHIVLYTNY